MKFTQILATLAAPVIATQLSAVQTRNLPPRPQRFCQGRTAQPHPLPRRPPDYRPAIETIAELDSSIIWSATQAPNGTLFIATGNKGKIVSISPNGEKKTIFSPEEMLARAIALGDDGALYVGTSPNGRIYRIPGPGRRAEIYYDPAETYIWDLKFAPDGALFVATGNRGRIYKLPRASNLVTSPNSGTKTSPPTSSPSPSAPMATSLPGPRRQCLPHDRAL